MVIHADIRRLIKHSLVGFALVREAVIGQPIALQVFAVVEAVPIKDTRLEEIRAWG